MRSFPIFTVLFLAVPIIEIYLLMEVGDVIGFFPTAFLVVLTAVLGAWLLRHQGLSTLARFQQNMSKGKLPAQELVEGILLAVGGALLMTPGFLTDTIGFLCLLPFSRKFIATQIIKNSAAKVSAKTGGYSQAGQWSQNEGDVIDGEFTEVEEDQIVISSSSSKKPSNKK